MSDLQRSFQQLQSLVMTTSDNFDKTRLQWVQMYEEVGDAGVVCRRSGISRPTLQAALRGKRVRPRTAFRLAQALSRFPVLEEITRLLEAG